MRATLRASLLLLLAAGALSGCSRNNPVATPATSGTSSSEAQVASEMTRQPGVVEDGVSDSEGEATIGATQGLAAIDPLTFWRRFEVRRRTFEFAFSDTDSTGLPTRAVVTIRTRLQGTFNILVGTPSDSAGATVAASTTGSADATRHVIHKPLDETRVRRVLLRRAPMPRDCDDSENRDEADHVRARWRLAAVSGVEVTSKDHTTTILSVRIQSGALDTTLTNPLAFIRLRGLLRIVPDSPVTLTVKTNHTDDVVLLHHNDHRLRLKSNGDGTYSGEFRSRLFVRGLWHFGIDAIAHATLYDDQAAYDSQRWVFPYVIAPWRMDGPAL